MCATTGELHVRFSLKVNNKINEKKGKKYICAGFVIRALVFVEYFHQHVTFSLSISFRALHG